jgi:hypothetical protein
MSQVFNFSILVFSLLIVIVISVKVVKEGLTIIRTKNYTFRFRGSSKKIKYTGTPAVTLGISHILLGSITLLFIFCLLILILV